MVCLYRDDHLHHNADWLRLKSGVTVWTRLENKLCLISVAVTVQLNEQQDVCKNSSRFSSRQWGLTCRMFARQWARRWISPPRVHTRLHLVRKTVTAGNRLQRQTSDYLRLQWRRLPVSVGCAGKHPSSFLTYMRRQSWGNRTGCGGWFFMKLIQENTIHSFVFLVHDW